MNSKTDDQTQPNVGQPTDRPLPWGVHRLSSMIGHPSTQGSKDGKAWLRAVPEPYEGELTRLRAAWWVLTGHAHAVVWPELGDLERALVAGDRE